MGFISQTVTDSAYLSYSFSQWTHRKRRLMFTCPPVSDHTFTFFPITNFEIHKYTTALNSWQRDRLRHRYSAGKRVLAVCVCVSEAALLAAGCWNSNTCMCLCSTRGTPPIFTHQIQSIGTWKQLYKGCLAVCDIIRITSSCWCFWQAKLHHDQ